MNNPPTVATLKSQVGQAVTLNGWLYNRRSSKAIHFLQFRDGTGVVQACVFKDKASPELFAMAGTLTQETSLTLSGMVVADDRSPLGAEIHVDSLTVHTLTKDYPIVISDVQSNPDFLLDHRHLWIRSKKQHALLRLRAYVINRLRNWLDDNGFICADTPIFTPNACEGTSTLFSVDYGEDQTVYLSQSGQLYNEATAQAFGKSYCFGPTFRAEKSKTRKHLREFWMLEPEMAYAGIDEVMKVEEAMVCSVVKDCLEHRLEDLKTLGADIAMLQGVKAPFTRLHYKEAREIILKAGVDMKEMDDFGAPQEEALMKEFKSPVFVHHFPTAIKAFYMERTKGDEKFCESVDLMAGNGVEICGGGARSWDLPWLESQIDHHGLKREDFKWYLDLRRFGGQPSAGFGLGLERFVGWIAGTEHVRECIPFPRTLYRVSP
ncbi:MAG: asparagine--tRNA ligase [Planctomycetota bacterium]